MTNSSLSTVVSVVGEIFTNPGGALTVIENGVLAVVTDIENVGEEIWTDIECLFGQCAPATTSADPAASLSNSCQGVLAAATSTYIPAAPTPTQAPAAITSVYQPPAAAKSHGLAPAATTSLQVTAVITQPPVVTFITSSSAPSTTAQASQTPNSSGSHNSIPGILFGLSVCSLFMIIVL